jgi:hypothetical protein
LGWLNPLEEMTDWRKGGPAFDVIVSQSGIGRTVNLLESSDPSAGMLAVLDLAEGTTFTVTDVAMAPPDGTGTSAEAYAVWYRTTVNGMEGWFSAIATSTEAVGSDGRPSAVDVLVVPVEDLRST